MTRVLITGVAGFIGSHVADYCLKQGFSVIGVDDLSGGFVENIPDGVDFRRGDITDPVFVANLWSDGNFDYIYHLAAYAAEGLSHFIRRFNYRNNLIGSVNLINEAVLHNVRCFVFTSSIAVYGRNQTPMTEDLQPNPEDPYGIAKYAVELDLEAAHKMFGLKYVIFRPHNVYGERQNCGDKYRNVIGIFMNQLMAGQPMTVFGSGAQTRAFSHIDDVAPVIARAPLVPESYQQVFNVGADQPYSILTLANEIAKAFGIKPSVQHLPARNEVVDAYASHANVKRIFRTSEPRSLTDGIKSMALWAKQRGIMKPVEFQEIEVGRDLPPSWRPKSI